MLRAISGRPRRSFVILSLSYRILDASNGRAVRDSKHPEGPILVFTRDEWRAFVQAVEAGKCASSAAVPGGQGSWPRRFTFFSPAQSLDENAHYHVTQRSLARGYASTCLDRYTT